MAETRLLERLTGVAAFGALDRTADAPHPGHPTVDAEPDPDRP
jgi:hypothetical protein